MFTVHAAMRAILPVLWRDPKEVWVVGADRYRNPDEDLPADFAKRRVPNGPVSGRADSIASHRESPSPHCSFCLHLSQMNFGGALSKDIAGPTPGAVKAVLRWPRVLDDTVAHELRSQPLVSDPSYAPCGWNGCSQLYGSEHGLPAAPGLRAYAVPFG